jgi:hypothetical protein
MLQLQIIIVSTRLGRAGLPVANWFMTQAEHHSKFALDVIGLMAKLIVTALKMMPMFEAVVLPFFAQQIDNEKGSFSPPKVQEDAAVTMLDELLKRATALSRTSS